MSQLILSLEPKADVLQKAIEDFKNTYWELPKFVVIHPELLELLLKEDSGVLERNKLKPFKTIDVEHDEIYLI